MRLVKEIYLPDRAPIWWLKCSTLRTSRFVPNPIWCAGCLCEGGEVYSCDESGNWEKANKGAREYETEEWIWYDRSTVVI